MSIKHDYKNKATTAHRHWANTGHLAVCALLGCAASTVLAEGGQAAQSVQAASVKAESVKATSVKVASAQAKTNTQAAQATTSAQQTEGLEDGELSPDVYLPEYKEENQDDSSQPVTKKRGKPSFFSRLYKKWFGDDVGSLEKITVLTEIKRDLAIQAKRDDNAWNAFFEMDKVETADNVSTGKNADTSLDAEPNVVDQHTAEHTADLDTADLDITLSTGEYDSAYQEAVEVSKSIPASDKAKPITAKVKEAERRMADNVRLALEQVTVDEFEDINVIIPRLRGIARDAAKATGFYDARFVFKKTDSDSLLVSILPNEPVIIRVSNVAIKGDANTLDAFKHILAAHTLGKGEVFNHGDYIQTKQALLQAAKNYGYFDHKLAASDVKVLIPENEATVNLVLNSGTRYDFGQVVYLNKKGERYIGNDIKNQIELDEKILTRLIPFDMGEPYSRAKLDKLGQNLLATQYFSAVDVNVIKPELGALSKGAALEFSEAPDEKASDALPKAKQNRFEKATAIIKRVASKAPQQGSVDSLSDADKRAQKQKREVKRSQAEKTKSIPIEVTIDTMYPNSAEVGLGYGTDTKFRVRGQISRNLVSHAGHSVSVNTELSKIRQSVELRYKKPYKHPLNDTFTAFTGYEREKLNRSEDRFDVLTEELVLGFQRDVLQGRWHHAGSLVYRLYELSYDDGVTTSVNVPTRFRNSIANTKQQALLLGYRLDNTYVQGGLFPHTGYRQYYQAEVGSKSVKSDVDMMILRAGYSALKSFGKARRHQVYGRIDAGKIVTKNFVGVPYKLRFFAGGDRSIRGYDYGSLSPMESGYLLGGEHLLTATLEYNYAVLPAWRPAIFADIGNAYNIGFSNETKVGAGLGVRWKSPVGPVRIDIAAGVTEKKPPIRLHFFIGPLF